MAARKRTPVRRRRISKFKKFKKRVADLRDTAARSSVYWFAGAACILLAAFVFTGAEKYVVANKKTPLYSPALRIQMKSLPDWVKQSSFVGEDLYEAVRPFELSLWENDLTSRIASRLESSAWIARVLQVQVSEKQDGGIYVESLFRRPAAFVRCGDLYYLVDETGVRLPRLWTVDALDQTPTKQIKIHGVRSAPPSPGEAWIGKDLLAALNVSAMLERMDYRPQIAAIDVGNYQGRQDPTASHLELVTTKGSRIRWGAAPGWEVPPEPQATTKLGMMESLYRNYGRVDMDLSYVDISRGPEHVQIPSRIKSPGRAPGVGRRDGDSPRLGSAKSFVIGQPGEIADQGEAGV
jgi:hypothetical protein